jgi:hypothetical protein
VLNKDKAEILLGTSNESLHKHGYRPFVRWGVLNETLAAAVVLESGILERAKKSGKLYVWDPFCGSGSFLIETLMAMLEQPVRMMDGVKFPFQEWPIHQKDQYEKFREELNEFQKIKQHIDVQIIGSDISIKAIDTADKNMEYANIDQITRDILDVESHPIINEPLIYAKHWPRAEENSLIDFSNKSQNTFMSLYHGDFNTIGAKLAPLTDNFKDFSIVTNVPYGHQSAVKQRMSARDT